MEQYMDFVLNRGFRQSLLCHAGVALDRRLRVERLTDLYVASSLKPVEPEESVPAGAEISFEHRSDHRSITAKGPLLTAALLQLAEVWPATRSTSPATPRWHAEA
jgi:methyltransferase-like protein